MIETSIIDKRLLQDRFNILIIMYLIQYDDKMAFKVKKKKYFLIAFKYLYLFLYNYIFFSFLESLYNN